MKENTKLELKYLLSIYKSLREQGLDYNRLLFRSAIIYLTVWAVVMGLVLNKIVLEDKSFESVFGNYWGITLLLLVPIINCLGMLLLGSLMHSVYLQRRYLIEDLSPRLTKITDTPLTSFDDIYIQDMVRKRFQGAIAFMAFAIVTTISLSVLYNSWSLINGGWHYPLALFWVGLILTLFYLSLVARSIVIHLKS